MRIGAYELLSEIGRGGTGVVHRARAPDGRVVAVKVLAGAATPEQLAVFEREKRLLGALGEADGFVPILDSGASPPFLVMPFLGGGTLHARLAKGPLRVEDAVALATKLAHALGRAHERGIVHRDFKPANVLFTDEGEPLVADLGLAKHFARNVKGASQSGSLSATGLIAGTPGYMAPEQIDDSKRVGPPADVFALGCVLHEALAGTKPYEAPSLLEYGVALAKGAPAPLRRLRPDVPRWLEALVLRALAKDPARRFADGHAFARALGAGGEALRGARRGVVAGVAVLAVAGLAAGLGAALLAAPSGSSVPERLPAPGPRSERPAPPPRPSAKDLVDRGVAALESGQALRAIDDFTRAIAAEPGYARAWHRRAAASNRVPGREADAIADARKATVLDPNDADAWAELGVSQLESNREAAREAVATALRLDPGNAIAHFACGVDSIDKKALDEAVAHLDVVIANGGPRLILALSYRAAALHKSGRLEAALADMTRAIELGGEHATPALSLRGDIYWDMHRVAEADADWKAYLDHEPDGPRADTMRTSRANAQVALGQRALAGGDRRRALECFALALELAPRHADALVARADLRLDEGDAAGAAADAGAAIEANPRDAHSFVVRGQARVGLGREREAFEDIDRALALEPDRVEALMARALHRHRTGDETGAKADIERAIAKAPEDRGPIMIRAEMRLESDPALAAAELAVIIRSEPRFVGARVVRAKALARIGRWVDAMSERNAVERLLVGRPEARAYLADLDADLDRVRKKARTSGPDRRPP